MVNQETTNVNSQPIKSSVLTGVVSLQIARVIGRGTPPREGRRDKLPVWRRLLQQYHSLGTLEVGVAEASAKTVGFIAFI